MIKCEVLASGKQQKVTLTLPEHTQWSDRFPRLRADNGVTIIWWDLETNQPFETAKWDARKKLLKLPIPLAKAVPPKGTRQSDSGISICVPPNDNPVVLGSICVSKASAALIEYAVGRLNEYVTKRPMLPSNPEGNDLWSELLDCVDVSPEAVAKLKEVIQQLGAEIDNRLDEMFSQMAAIQKARSRIDFLSSLTDKWSIPKPPDEPSMLGCIQL